MQTGNVHQMHYSLQWSSWKACGSVWVAPAPQGAHQGRSWEQVELWGYPSTHCCLGQNLSFTQELWAKGDLQDFQAVFEKKWIEMRGL